MGTGIVSILLNTLPYNGQWLYYLSIIIFVLNVAYFTIFLAVTLLRYILYPEIFRVMVTHPVQSLFLGTFPMGLATIINMFCLVCVSRWGDGAAYFIWAVWVFDAVVSVLVAIGIPFLLYWSLPIWVCFSVNANSQDNEEEWTRPFLYDCCLASASRLVCCGGGVGFHGCRCFAGRTTCPCYYPGKLYSLGIGVPLAMMIMGIYLQRLMFHKLPPNGMLVSVFLPLGPLGQGSFG